MRNVKDILTERFLLRPLKSSDASYEYLGWFTETDTKKYIVAASHKLDLDKLSTYIEEKVNDEEILFLGIFDRFSGVHVGNIKYEPIDTDLQYAIMGILIGNKEYRGKGVTPEVLNASAMWLKQNKNIKHIVLGVDVENHAAIKAYEKVGFFISQTTILAQPLKNCITMQWDL